MQLNYCQQCKNITFYLFTLKEKYNNYTQSGYRLKHNLLCHLCVIHWFYIAAVSTKNKKEEIQVLQIWRNRSTIARVANKTRAATTREKVHKILCQRWFIQYQILNNEVNGKPYYYNCGCSNRKYNTIVENGVILWLSTRTRNFLRQDNHPHLLRPDGLSFLIWWMPLNGNQVTGVTGWVWVLCILWYAWVGTRKCIWPRKTSFSYIS